MSFKRGNFGKFLTSAVPPSLDGMYQPLPQAFPGYCVVKRPNGIHEFRVEAQSYFRARNASASYYADPLDWAPVLIFPILGAVAWQMVCTLLAYAHETSLNLPQVHRWVLILGFLVLLVPFGYWRATQVLWGDILSFRYPPSPRITVIMDP